MDEKKHASLIVATHCPEFLMGCLQSVSSSEISIIRLTYQGLLGSVNKLESNEISKYVTDSILKRSEVLNALFHNSAVVTESWDDKVIYREATDKLLEYRIGINDTVFLNTNGKDSIHRITTPLRKVAIYDLDVLKEKQLFKTILSSSNIEPSMIIYFEGERKSIKSGIDTLNEKKQGEENYFKNLPINKIPVKLHRRISVPIGELEQWLRDVHNKKQDKPFIKILHKIKETTPTQDDIWQFIDDINIWTSNPERKGMN